MRLISVPGCRSPAWWGCWTWTGWRRGEGRKHWICGCDHHAHSFVPHSLKPLEAYSSSFMSSCMNMPYNEIKSSIYKHMGSLISWCLRLSTSVSIRPLSIKFVLQWTVGSFSLQWREWQFYGCWSNNVFLLECLCVVHQEKCVWPSRLHSHRPCSWQPSSTRPWFWNSGLLSGPRGHVCSSFNLF